MTHIFQKTIEHLFITLGALFIALLIALPLGAYLTRSPYQRLALWIVRGVGLIQTLPGLAMIASIVVLLASLPSSLNIPATGYLPGVLGLSLYAISPILTNTYTGIKQVSLPMVEVARGLGMTPNQILFLVEVPTAIPTILAGMRISAVWTIGMATLTSLVGSGGLGDLIMQGLRSMRPGLVMAGTIPALALALLFEWGFSRLEHWLGHAPADAKA